MYNSQAKQNTSKKHIILKSPQSYLSRIGDSFGFVNYGFVGYGLPPTFPPSSYWWGRSFVPFCG
ncbi:hypothetical protein PMIT1303_00095 [Prochlorococcus sp. MIT 1303]|nr:hypothetical protein PMIT1303_00095 [Prochlorococcus sp. MIT 1303]